MSIQKYQIRFRRENSAMQNWQPRPLDITVSRANVVRARVVVHVVSRNWMR